MSLQPKLVRFKQSVLSKYNIYNSIFMTLPFDTITKTGVLLPLFHETCRKGFANGDEFFARVVTQNISLKDGSDQRVKEFKLGPYRVADGLLSIEVPGLDKFTRIDFTKKRWVV